MGTPVCAHKQQKPALPRSVLPGFGSVAEHQPAQRAMYLCSHEVWRICCCDCALVRLCTCNTQTWQHAQRAQSLAVEYGRTTLSRALLGSSVRRPFSLSYRRELSSLSVVQS